MATETTTTTTTTSTESVCPVCHADAQWGERCDRDAHASAAPAPHYHADTARIIARATDEAQRKGGLASFDAAMVAARYVERERLAGELATWKEAHPAATAEQTLAFAEALLRCDY